MKYVIVIAFIFGSVNPSPLQSDDRFCHNDNECRDLILCGGEDQSCHCGKNNRCHFSDLTKRPRWRRSVVEERSMEDIGPDTCGQDRQVLSNWFLTHGSPNLLEEPIPEVVNPTNPNPYDDPENPPTSPDLYCAVKYSADRRDDRGNKFYTLANFESPEAAVSAGFAVTHRGHCGSCSSLQDLGVYMGRNLTTPTRLCGLEGTLSKPAMRLCLRNLGFSDNCIPIWEYNILNTKKNCFFTCIWSWLTNEPFNKPDGSLNDCLQCDEDKSGPNFKYFSGRTRRNSGIPSSIYRPPSTVYNMTHCYWYGDL